MTTEQQRIADGLELLLNALNDRVRSAVYGVENKCNNAKEKQYLLEGEALCKAAEKATGDLLAAIAEYRATAKQLTDFRIASRPPAGGANG